VRFANNLVQVNPPIYVPNAVITHGWGLDSAGPTTNFIVDHNTFIVCPTNVSASNSSFAHSPYGLANAQQTLDRITFTNNVMDGTFALQSLVPTQSGGTTAFNTAFSNCIAGGNPAAQPAWNDNITIIDSRAYPSGTLATNVTYPGVGMANFVNNATSPSSPSDWNVVSGTYATASTTGGPIGSTFLSFDPNGLILGNSLQGIALQIPGPSGSFGSGQWIAYTGTDTKYGNVLPRGITVSPWGGNATLIDQVQQIYGTLGTSQADIAESIATDNTVPAGVSTRVAVETLITAYNSSKVNQDSYIIHPNITVGTFPQGMLYTSRWVWLQADLASRVGGGFNQEVCETKTPDGNGTFQGPDRLQMNIVISTGTPWGLTAPACFNFTHSTEISNSGPISQQSNTWVAPDAAHPSGGYTAGITYSPVAVPLGRWFRIEWAFNRLDSTGQGWMWCAITDPGSSDPNLRAGIQIFAARGAFTFVDPWGSGTWTCGMNPTPGISGHQPAQPYYDRIFLNNLSYGGIVRGGTAGNYVIKWTDMQVYARWPSTATAHPSNYL